MTRDSYKGMQDARVNSNFTSYMNVDTLDLFNHGDDDDVKSLVTPVSECRMRKHKEGEESDEKHPDPSCVTWKEAPSALSMLDLK